MSHAYQTTNCLVAQTINLFCTFFLLPKISMQYTVCMTFFSSVLIQGLHVLGKRCDWLKLNIWMHFRGLSRQSNRIKHTQKPMSTNTSYTLQKLTHSQWKPLVKFKIHEIATTTKINYVWVRSVFVQRNRIDLNLKWALHCDKSVWLVWIWKLYSFQREANERKPNDELSIRAMVKIRWNMLTIATLSISFLMRVVACIAAIDIDITLPKRWIHKFHKYIMVGMRTKSSKTC